MKSDNDILIEEAKSTYSRLQSIHEDSVAAHKVLCSNAQVANLLLKQIVNALHLIVIIILVAVGIMIFS